MRPDWLKNVPRAFQSLGIIALMLSGCAEDSVTNVTDYSQDTVAVDSVGKALTALPDPPFSRGIMALLRPADGFDYPVGPPDSRNYYKFRGFQPMNLEHLGEDWNGVGGGNTDFGDYVHAVADGVTFSAQHHGPGWGTVIRILHNYGTKENPKYVESVYAHVEASWVRPGFRVKRGEKVGTMGTAENKYHAHLHFEMRKEVGKEIGCGYAGDTAGFVDPTAFIEAHRPVKKP